MSIRLTLSTRNLRGLVANLRAGDEILQRTARKTVRTYGRRQKRLTEELAPYDTSKPAEEFHMRDNVRLRFSDDGLVYEVGFVEEDFTAAGRPFYAVYTEFGTRFMTPRPCVFPARDAILPEFKSALSANLRGAYRRRKAS